MTPQEIYDTVAKHLFAQGMRSQGAHPDKDSMVCLYRGPNGTKCAVGVLIPDEFYDPEMESNALVHLFDPDVTPDGGFKLPAWMKENLSLLMRLQHTHDCSWHWHQSERMKERLRQVAQDHELSVAVLDGLKFAWEVEVEAK